MSAPLVAATFVQDADSSVTSFGSEADRNIDELERGLLEVMPF